MATDPSGYGLQSVAMQRSMYVATATIASGQSLSGAIDLAGTVLFAIAMPAAWTTAALTFQAASTKDGTYGDVYGDDGIEVTIASGTAAGGRMIVPAGILENLAPLRFLKVRSGTAGVPVAQGADRSIQFIVKG